MRIFVVVAALLGLAFSGGRWVEAKLHRNETAKASWIAGRAQSLAREASEQAALEGARADALAQRVKTIEDQTTGPPTTACCLLPIVIVPAAALAVWGPSLLPLEWIGDTYKDWSAAVGAGIALLGATLALFARTFWQRHWVDVLALCTIATGALMVLVTSIP